MRLLRSGSAFSRVSGSRPDVSAFDGVDAHVDPQRDHYSPPSWHPYVVPRAAGSPGAKRHANHEDHQASDEDSTDQPCTIHISIMSVRCDEGAGCSPSSNADTSRGDALVYFIRPPMRRRWSVRISRDVRGSACGLRRSMQHLG